MTRNDDQENGGYYYRATAQTPGLPRMDTWLGRFPGSSLDNGHHAHGPGQAVSPDSYDEEDAFDLKAEVVVCIAKSIGLSQQTVDGQLDPMMRGSVASASILSSPNSPMFPPNHRGNAHGSGRSPFGNVLDMMNASSQQDGVLGGMLREAVMTAKMDEDASASSFSMSHHESGVGGGDGMRSTLRDLEDNLEILHYKKGSVLVKEGEKAQGLYYVIDGFLDVSEPIYTKDEYCTNYIGIDQYTIRR
jgi:lysophospholipid hydrolase